MALTDFIDALTPPWAKAAKRVHWWGMFRLVAVVVDALLEGVWQGRKAGMPNAVDLPGIEDYGGFEDVRSLDYIGEDLGVLHGLTEPPPDYAYRLRHAQDEQGWLSAGTVIGILNEVAAILGPTPPIIRIVTEQGRWWSRLQDGTILFQTPAGDGKRYNPDGTVEPDTTTTVAWVWDRFTDPPPGDQNAAGRWWMILYAPIDTPYGTSTDGTFNDPGLVGDFWDDPTSYSPDPGPWAGTVGTNAPACLIELLRTVIDQRSTVGFPCAYIICAFDPNSFAPDGSSSAYPDGKWGHHTYYDAGTNTRIVARLDTAEYWPGAPGGLAP